MIGFPVGARLCAFFPSLWRLPAWYLRMIGHGLIADSKAFGNGGIRKSYHQVAGKNLPGFDIESGGGQAGVDRRVLDIGVSQPVLDKR